MKPNIVFTGTKLSSNFNVKDHVPFTKKHDAIYRSVSATESVMRAMLVSVLGGYVSV